MNIYIIPAGPNQFPKEYFKGKGISFRPYDGGSPNALFWNSFYEECAKRGISVKSYLSWSKELSESDDMLLVLNHPGETFFWRIYYSITRFRDKGGFLMKRRRFFMGNYTFFKRRVLIQLEPPVAMPYVYSQLDSIVKHGFYQKQFAIVRLPNAGWEYFNYFDNRTQNIKSPYFDSPKTKYLTLINSNVRPHKLSNELYGERLKAIKFFSGIEGFDLYGFDWDKRPRHPFYPHYEKYVRCSWKGEVPDKLKTLSEYKFSIVFENDIHPGWVSEKIFDSLAAGSIPVYLGAPDIEKTVPADCFIDFRKFKEYEELHKFLTSLSEDEISTYRKRISDFLDIPPKPRVMENFMNAILGVDKR